ncbi:MAG: hypothetical protein M1830_007099, partial [Pleopsidium flavum]
VLAETNTIGNLASLFWIRRSIDLEESDGKGRTALLRLLYAQGRSDLSMITMLLYHGANVAALNFSGQGCLHTILNNYARKGVGVGTLPECLSILLDRGADIYAIDLDGRSVTATAMLTCLANTWFDSLGTSTHGYDVREVLVKEHYQYHSYVRSGSRGAERRSKQTDVPDAETREDLDRRSSDCDSEDAESEVSDCEDLVSVDFTCSDCDPKNCNWMRWTLKNAKDLYSQFSLKHDQDCTKVIPEESSLEKEDNVSGCVNSNAGSAENEGHSSSASSCTDYELLFAPTHPDGAVAPWAYQAVDNPGKNIDHSTLPSSLLKPETAMYFNPWIEPSFSSHAAGKTRLA